VLQGLWPGTQRMAVFRPGVCVRPTLTPVAAGSDRQEPRELVTKAQLLLYAIKRRYIHQIMAWFAVQEDRHGHRSHPVGGRNR